MGRSLGVRGIKVAVKGEERRVSNYKNETWEGVLSFGVLAPDGQGTGGRNGVQP